MRRADAGGAHGAGAPGRNAGFSGLWDETVRRWQDRPFLIFEDERGDRSEWSYAEFDVAVGHAAARLAEWGVVAGNRVHLAVANSPAFVALWLAAARIGACIVPGDPRMTSRDVAEQAERVGAVIGICASARAAIYRRGAAEIALPVHELSETAADLLPGGALRSSGTIGVALPVGGSQLLAVMFTSGTTSRPKGVELTHANYRSVAARMSAVVGLREHHRWLVVLPLFHANAQYYCFAAAIQTGASVALAGRFSASGYIDQARRLAATHASLFAAPMRMILARTPEGAEPAALEHVWFAQNLGAEHYERFARLAGCRPTQLYGMTETVAAVTADTGGARRNDSIGEALPGRPIRVLTEHGSPAEPGEPGMLWVRGVLGDDLFRGYLDDPTATERSLERIGGRSDPRVWFCTGDLVAPRADGGLAFVGRVDDVVKVSGENVSLGEIEATVAQAPGVLEAAVVGEPDPIRDTVPVAYVVPSDAAAPPTPEDLDRWAEGALSPASRPRRWELIDELPRTSVGKVKRFALGGGGR